MKNITKAELAAENAALRKQLGDMELQHAIELHTAKGGKPIPRFLQRELPLHMQRAKEMAIRSGRSVKVG